VVERMNIHHHLIVRAEILIPPRKSDIDFITRWLDTLISDINMNILEGPIAIYCEKEGNRGMTAFAIIDTSHIALHTWDEESPGMMQLDVYSCAPFNLDNIIDSLAIFAPVHIDYKFLDRTDNFIVIK
jgi:S-adenosylmethionine/arginine decarboxylase-like enzyme